MLARQNRLSGKSVFERVKKRGNIWQSKTFGVGFLERKDVNPSRFGFVVSTKVSKRASHRNRIKRILRDAVRDNLLNIKSGYDIIFLAKKAIENRSKDEIGKEVNNFFSNLKSYNKE
jgi:ribonuclease P protein component